MAANSLRIPQPVAYSCTNTDEILADTDIRCPPFESYADKIVEYVQVRVRERRAKKAALENDDPLV